MQKNTVETCKQKNFSFDSKVWNVSCIFLLAVLITPFRAYSVESEWSMGVYGGQYYDSEPAGMVTGRGNFLNQYMAAVTASKLLWRAETLPLSLELDGMVGYQSGLDSLYEVAIAPVLRWSSFPWNNILQTDLRAGPLGLSYTTKISSLEQGVDGKGSNFLNFLMVEMAFSLPENKSNEVFLRLHHRCAIYDVLNNYGANGEDFLALGYRQYF